MDGQFDALQENYTSMQITLNIALNNEHVLEVERHIRTIKEPARAVYSMLPFPRLPSQMTIELIIYRTF